MRRLLYIPLTLVLMFSSVSFSTEDEESFKTACFGDYQVSPGYRQFSPKDQDRRACRGVVGESFCLEEKEEQFLASCVQQKKQLVETQKLKQQINLQLPSDLGGEQRQPTSAEEPGDTDAEGFKDL